MKIKIEHGDYEENEILLRCREVDSEIMRIIAFLNLQTQSHQRLEEQGRNNNA